MTRPLPASPFPFLAHSHPSLYHFNTQLYTVWGHDSIMSHGLFLCLECQPLLGPFLLGSPNQLLLIFQWISSSSLSFRKAPWNLQIVLTTLLKLPRSHSGKESACQCRRCTRLKFDPWVRNPWRRKWQPSPVVVPGKSHGPEEPGWLQSIGSQRVGHDWARTEFLLKSHVTDHFRVHVVYFCVCFTFTLLDHDLMQGRNHDSFIFVSQRSTVGLWYLEDTRKVFEEFTHSQNSEDAWVPSAVLPPPGQKLLVCTVK